MCHLKMLFNKRVYYLNKQMQNPCKETILNNGNKIKYIEKEIIENFKNLNKKKKFEYININYLQLQSFLK